MIRPMQITAQEAMELAERVEEACPGLSDGLGVPTGNLISEVVDQAGALLAELTAAGERGIDANLAVALMVQGAMAHLADALPPARLEVKLNRAGRAIGRFMSTKFGEKIREELPEAKA